MNFESFGPFDFDPMSVENRWRAKFWSDIRADYDYPDDLSSGIGCYAFCVCFGTNIKPWYIGKTCSKGGFRSEVFQPHKLKHYCDVLEGKKGKAQIILFPLVTPDTWKISKNRTGSRTCIDWLETTLIGMAISRNPDIANVSKTMHHRSVYVRGILGAPDAGAPTLDARAARTAFLNW